MQAKVKQVARTKQKTEVQPQAPKSKGAALLDDIDNLLDEIDEVLEEVAGGKESELALQFVRNYVQKGGQ